jgi:hypothetical protein
VAWPGLAVIPAHGSRANGAAQMCPRAVNAPGADNVVRPVFARRGLRSGVADGKGPVGRRLPAWARRSGWGLTVEARRRRAEKNDDAVEFGRRRGAPMSSGGQRVDLRQGNEKGRVRSGSIVDVVHERVELTR